MKVAVVRLEMPFWRELSFVLEAAVMASVRDDRSKVRGKHQSLDSELVVQSRP